MPSISSEQWQSYDQDGFLPLGRTLEPARVQVLVGRMNAIMLGEIQYPQMLMQLDGGGAYDSMPEMTRGFKGPRLDYRKIEDLEKDELFLNFMQNPTFREACGRVYGSATSISIYRAMFMNKPARKGTDLPWHQDGGRNWNLDPEPLLTAWTALTPATP